MEETVLLPCPVCKSIDLEIASEGDMIESYYVFCRTCEISGPYCDTDENAIQTWNALPRIPWKQAAKKWRKEAIMQHMYVFELEAALRHARGQE